MTQVTDILQKTIQHINAGDFIQAESLCRQILTRDPSQAAALHLLGLIFHRMAKSPEAINYLTQAIQASPHAAEYHYNLGVVLADLGESKKAAKAYEASLRLKPDYPEALNNLGLIFYDLNKLEEAVMAFRQAIRHQPQFTNAQYNLGKALQALGDPEGAVAAYDAVLKILPDSAETRFNRSLALLTTGNYQDGWEQYEWRLKQAGSVAGSPRADDSARWAGDALIGKKLLVLDEQGFGDTFQFVRYLPLVKALGGEVIFETVQPLVRIMRNISGVDKLVVRSNAEQDLIDFDCYIPLMSLPGIFKTRLETIPDKVPYIFPDNAKMHYWADRLASDGFKVGLVWSGKTSDDYRNSSRSGLEHFNLEWSGRPASKFASDRLTGLENFTPLAAVPGIHFYGLQKGPAASEAHLKTGSLPLMNLDQDLQDFSDTAAVMANLDLVISVDTAVAHLAGAMGRPVWVLVPYVPDWRWLRDRRDSPWYPTMRLFRQRARNDWAGAIHQLADELHSLVH